MRLRNSLIILGVLEDQDIEWFVRVGQTTVLQEADILIEEGIHIESLWFVLDGALTVTTVHDTSKVLGTVYPGEIVGEVSLLDSRPPAVTLIAAESTTVLQISRSELKTKLSNDTGFASRFYRAVGIVLAQRLIHLTHTTLTVSTIGKVGSANPGEVEGSSVVDPEVLEAMSLASRRFEYLLERATRN